MAMKLEMCRVTLILRSHTWKCQRLMTSMALGRVNKFVEWRVTEVETKRE